MIHTIIKENMYQDSVSLMLLTNQLSSMDGINKIFIMMGTPANKDIFRNTGLYTDRLEMAKPNDICIVIDTGGEEKISVVLDQIDQFLNNQVTSGSKSAFKTVRTWDRALKQLPNANIAMISVPGEYVAEEAEKALDKGLHAFIFSDNVSIEDEIRIKQKAHEKGLLVMGPDCGTGIISGVPLAFANVVNDGNIGIVGASGTGIQEVTCLIDRLGGGVSHALGTGGRDLSEGVGALTMLDAISALENHEGTEIIVVISKPPAAEVRTKVENVLQHLSKPAVAIFMGEKPIEHIGNVRFAHTLEETAQLAVSIAKESIISESHEVEISLEKKLQPEQTSIKGLYSGGTLATEAAMLMKDALYLAEGEYKTDGFLLNARGHVVVDLGDDLYTKGKPHPMIDPTTRIEFIKRAAKEEDTAVILLDVVLGYGGSDDMAGQIVPAIKEITRSMEREIYIIAALCGTKQDPQGYAEQKERLMDAGIHVEESNAKAVQAALKVLGHEYSTITKKYRSLADKPVVEKLEVSTSLVNLLHSKPAIINIGLKKFTKAIVDHGGSVVQYDWQPVAGGNAKLSKILSVMK